MAMDKKLSQNELSERLKIAKTLIEIGATYRHYKSADMMYEVKDIVIQEADNEPCVIYRALYGNHITFSRPVKSWIEMVEAEGRPTTRFTKLR